MIIMIIATADVSSNAAMASRHWQAGCHRRPAVGWWQVNASISQKSSVSNGVKNTETSRIFSIKTKRDI